MKTLKEIYTLNECSNNKSWVRLDSIKRRWCEIIFEYYSGWAFWGFG
ncbi:hypothetical protein HNQ88_002314 [Aureibacter tunicatorum]|uniref:Uncharacterized protein n=1 Tax=Aureibacter tunicatorum TaxID=866807 RepID=A0AAE4BT81_9BACT|nr:hypothetical protein [Aureibacter tunicatorum]BDD04798.1 hypothetical protein AUTU_22810 [Aureibacter tunicatorum]